MLSAAQILAFPPSSRAGTSCSKMLLPTAIRSSKRRDILPPTAMASVSPGQVLSFSNFSLTFSFAFNLLPRHFPKGVPIHAQQLTRIWGLIRRREFIHTSKVFPSRSSTSFPTRGDSHNKAHPRSRAFACGAQTNPYFLPALVFHSSPTPWTTQHKTTLNYSFDHSVNLKNRVLILNLRIHSPFSALSSLLEPNSQS